MNRYKEHRKEIESFVTMLSLVLVGACSGGSTPPAQESAPPGSVAISAATASTDSEDAAFAFDHDLQNAWNSGTFVPGWIQLDLGQPRAITRLRLYTAQTPAGPTSHQILGGATPDNLALLGTLDGNTAGGQWLEFAVKADVRYLKIVTVKSPSWVAWGEIEVYE
jgi:hypothetical protein